MNANFNRTDLSVIFQQICLVSAVHVILSILRQRYQQLLAVVSHYILNSSLIISGQTKRLQKKAKEEDLKAFAAIALQTEKNETILKLMQDAEFLQKIDPSDNTYQKLIDLNRRIEEHLKE